MGGGGGGGGGSYKTKPPARSRLASVLPHSRRRPSVRPAALALGYALGPRAEPRPVPGRVLQLAGLALLFAAFAPELKSARLSHSSGAHLLQDRVPVRVHPSLLVGRYLRRRSDRRSARVVGAGTPTVALRSGS